MQKVLCWNCRKLVGYNVKSVEEKHMFNIKGKTYEKEYNFNYAYCKECGEEIEIPGMDDKNIEQVDNDYKRAVLNNID